MKKWLQKVDALIEKIPPHIRDIIQKASIAVFALLALVTVSLSVMKGLRDARPTGMQVAKDSQDIFYLQMLRSQNREKAKLLEDIPVDAADFPSHSANPESSFMFLGADRSQRLMGEKDEFYNTTQDLRRDQSNIAPMLLPVTAPDEASERRYIWQEQKLDMAKNSSNEVKSVDSEKKGGQFLGQVKPDDAEAESDETKKLPFLE